MSDFSLTAINDRISKASTFVQPLRHNLNRVIVGQEKLIDNSPEIKKEMINMSHGKKTVPQVFIGNIHLGGYDDLEIAFKSGRLLEILDEK